MTGVPFLDGIVGGALVLFGTWWAFETAAHWAAGLLLAPLSDDGPDRD